MATYEQYDRNGNVISSTVIPDAAYNVSVETIIDRFTNTELAALYTSTTGSIIRIRLKMLCRLVNGLDVRSTEAVSAATALVNAGVLTVQRAQTIFAEG